MYYSSCRAGWRTSTPPSAQYINSSKQANRMARTYRYTRRPSHSKKRLSIFWRRVWVGLPIFRSGGCRGRTRGCPGSGSGAALSRCLGLRSNLNLHHYLLKLPNRLCGKRMSRKSTNQGIHTRLLFWLFQLVSQDTLFSWDVSLTFTLFLWQFWILKTLNSFLDLPLYKACIHALIIYIRVPLLSILYSLRIYIFASTFDDLSWKSCLKLQAL